jgi:hypothetical protein
MLSFIFLVGYAFSAWGMEEPEKFFDYEAEASEKSEKREQLPKVRKNGLRPILSVDELGIVTCELCQDRVIDSKLACEHKFCDDCITEWMGKELEKTGVATCPICRKPFTEITAVAPMPVDRFQPSRQEEDAKLEALIRQRKINSKEKGQATEAHTHSAPPSPNINARAATPKQETKPSILTILFSPGSLRKQPLSPKYRKLLLT